jgi:hypothetical protein
MATTTNYGWTTPDNTALVKDGASAIRTLGSSVDTSLKSLSPGTTAGDIDYYTSSTAKSRIGIGSSGQVLTVSGGVPAWATASSGSMTQLASGTLSGASVTISSISGSYQDLLLVITNRVNATAGRAGVIRLNGDSGTNYTMATTYSQDAAAGITTPDQNFMRTSGDAVSSGSSYSQENIRIYNYTNTSIHKIADIQAYANNTSATIRNVIGFYKSLSAITSITILAETGNLTSGNYVLYGVK